MTGPDRHDLTVTVPWMREGTALLLETADRLTDTDLRAPSTLPGWTRAHVIGHLARNAEALVRLTAWARTGVPTPMYADREQRAAEIQSSAALAPDALRGELKSTAAQLQDALGTLDATTWQAEIQSALGRTIPAAEIPWMRVREVWLHTVDLATGTTCADLPADLVDTLLDDVTGTLATRPGCPAVRLAPTDRDATWQFGRAMADAHTEVEAPAAELLAWTTGRAVRADPVTLPPWL
jgi:maleylpyruvate isomerase